MTRPALTLQDLRVLLSISAAKAGPNEDALWTESVVCVVAPESAGDGEP
jgi:hypothetical protein